MSADLGIAKNASDVPGLARSRDRDGIGIHPNHDDRGLGLLGLEFSAMEILEVRWLAVDQLADLDVLRLDRFEGDIIDDANARRPNRPLDGLGALLLGRPRAEIREPYEHREQDRGKSCK